MAGWREVVGMLFGVILLRYPFIWPPFAASCLYLGSSCREEEEEEKEEERRLLGHICRSLVTYRTGRRKAPTGRGACGRGSFWPARGGARA